MKSFRHFLLINAVHRNGVTQDTNKRITDTDISNALMIRLIISLIFSLPLLFISLGHLLGMRLPGLIDPAIYPFNFEMLRLILTLPVVITGWRIYFEGFKSLCTLHPNFYSLPAVAATAAFGFGIYALVRLTQSPSNYAINLYFETGAVILTLVTLEKYTESLLFRKAVNNTGLFSELPQKETHVLRNNTEYKLPIAEIQKDDIIVIHPGEAVPADGIIVSGFTFIDESELTGNSLPVERGPEQAVWAFSRNIADIIHIRVNSPPDSSFHAQLTDMVRSPVIQRGRAPETAVTIASWFVPAVIVLGIITSFTWYLIGRDIAFAVTVFIAVLTAACPCCMLSAIHTLIIAAMGRGIRSGFVMKNGEILEKTAEMNTVIFSGAEHTADLAEAAARLSREGIYSIAIASDKVPINTVSDGEDTGTDVHTVSETVARDMFFQARAVGNITGIVSQSAQDFNLLSNADIRILAEKTEDISSSRADILLMDNRLFTLSKAVFLSRAFGAKVKRGAVFAVIFNLISIPIAMGLLSLLNGPLFNPMLGTLCMVVFSIFITAYGLRLPHFTD